VNIGGFFVSLYNLSLGPLKTALSQEKESFSWQRETSY